MATNTLIPSTGKPETAAPRRSYWKVFAITYTCFLVMIAIVAGVIGYPLFGHLRRALQDEITRNLRQKAQMLANRINADHAHGLDVIASQEGQAAGTRATVVDTNGRAVADSEIAVSSLQNEGRLPEFVAALRGSTGVEIRARNGAQVLFVAVPVSGGAVRLAYPLSDIDVAIHDTARTLLLGCVLAVAIGAVLAAGFSRIVAG